MRSKKLSIEAREWLWAGVVTLIAVGLTLIPYALGYLNARDGWEFTGILMNPEDSQSYFAKMLQGYDGKSLYTIPFTPEPHAGAFVGMFYVWLGHLARISGVGLPVIWHVSRAAADAIMFLVTFGFISSYLGDRRTRKVAFLVAVFGSGLGWALFLANQPYWLDSFPVDFKQPGAHLFFSALTFPHVALGTALTIIAVRLCDELVSGADEMGIPWGRVLAAGATNLALVIVYPFLIYLVAAVALLTWILLVWLKKRLLWREGFLLASTFVLQTPLTIYYAYTLRTNAVFKAWDAQAGTPALPWPHYLIAYGPMLLLAYFFWRDKPQSRTRFAVLWIWILAAAALLYMPLRPQRRFVQGVHVPLSILASAGFLQTLLPWVKQTTLWKKVVDLPRYSPETLSRFLVMLFVLFMSLSNFYVLASVSVSSANQQLDTIFRPVDEIEMTRWLRHEVPATSVLLADYLTGNYVAANGGHRVVLGHWAETMGYEEKQEAVATFFDSASGDQFRLELLSTYGVDFVWHGPRERELGGFDPRTVDYLDHVHTVGDISVFATLSRLDTN